MAVRVRKNSVQKAADLVGSQSKLAVKLGITAQAVQQWVEKGQPPAERVLDIERATDGKITRHQLRPDLYPLERELRSATAQPAGAR